MTEFLVLSIFCTVLGSTVAVKTLHCGHPGGGGCPQYSMCMVQEGGTAVCSVMCDDQAVQRCVDNWEDFPGSAGLSQCYVSNNETLCSCLASAYNTGSKCLSVWWLIGPAVGAGVLLTTIFIIVIVIIIKRNRVRSESSVGEDIEMDDDRVRSQTNASMVNYVEFPSRNVSQANLDEANRSSSTDEGHSEVGDNATIPEHTEEERAHSENSGFGEHEDSPFNTNARVCSEVPSFGEHRDASVGLHEQDRRSYHGFDLYDNNFQREPGELQENTLYEGSSQCSPSLYDEVREFPCHLSNYHGVQPYATSVRAIPRPSIIHEEEIILEEDDTV